MQVFAYNALSICLYLIPFLFLVFIDLRLILVLSSIYANIEIMRNNNKELKFEFGKCCTHIRTQRMNGASAWFGASVLRLGSATLTNQRSATDAQQPMLSNQT